MHKRELFSGQDEEPCDGQQGDHVVLPALLGPSSASVNPDEDNY